MRMQDLSFLELLMIASIFAVYFLPSLIAFAREHKNKLAIFLLNLLLKTLHFAKASLFFPALLELFQLP